MQEEEVVVVQVDEWDSLLFCQLYRIRVARTEYQHLVGGSAKSAYVEIDGPSPGSPDTYHLPLFRRPLVGQDSIAILPCKLRFQRLEHFVEAIRDRLEW